MPIDDKGKIWLGLNLGRSNGNGYLIISLPINEGEGCTEAL